MGASNTTPEFPLEILTAFEKRFLAQKCHLGPGDYLPMYILAYELIFFLRNDESQHSVERFLQKRTGRETPTQHDWLTYSKRFLHEYFQKNRHNDRFLVYGNTDLGIVIGLSIRESSICRM